jgi:hypothetical protein
MSQPHTHPIPVIPSQREFSYPKEHVKARPVSYAPLDAILTCDWSTDAHMAAYSVPELPYRLSTHAVYLDNDVLMVLFIVDVDCEQSHAASGGHGDLPAPDDWWLSELHKLDGLRHAFPGAFIYRTRGGYRILYWLPVPYRLQTDVDIDAWKLRYLSWVAALRQRFHIYADPACQDWTRLFRVPHATRTPGSSPDYYEILDRPDQIGLWTCVPTDQEMDMAKTLTKRPGMPRKQREDTLITVAAAGDGALYHAFRSRGWIGRQIEAGKWSVRCPWEDRHTKGAPFNTSTVLFGPGPGDRWGWLHCSHAHCQGRDLRDVLRLFSESELIPAKREAGVITPPAHRKLLRRMYRPYFGLRVKGVRHAS